MVWELRRSVDETLYYTKAELDADHKAMAADDNLYTILKLYVIPKKERFRV